MKNKAFLISLSSAALANFLFFLLPQRRVIAFLVYLFSIFTGLQVARWGRELLLSIRRVYRFFGRNAILLVMLILLIFHFLGLDKIPFVITGDQVRDGGLNARQILMGEIKDPFGYGRYCSHGLIIPSLITPFYLVFPNSVYAYRLPATILGLIASVLTLLTFFQLSKRRPKRADLFLLLIPLFLSSQPQFLFYSRTEAVIAFSFLLSSLLLFLSFWLLNQNRADWSQLFVFGILSGFSLNFHAGLRPFVILLNLLVLVSLKERKTKNIFYYLLGFWIGCWPRVWSGSSRCFFHIERWSRASLLGLLGRYFSSLTIYLGSPIKGFCPFEKPIFPSPLTLFFLVGLGGFLIFKVGRVAAALLLVILFTNSAFTDMINAPHRLAPLYPLIAITLFWGMAIAVNEVRKGRTIVKMMIFLILAAIIINNFSQIFFGSLFDKNQPRERLVVSQLVRELRDLGVRRKGEICILAGRELYDSLRLLHNQEALVYFLSGIEPKAVYVEKLGPFDYQLIRCSDRRK